MELTEDQKKFVALAIQGLCMRQGPPTFEFASAISEILGLEAYLKDFLTNWISYAERQAGQSLTPGPGTEQTE